MNFFSDNIEVFLILTCQYIFFIESKGLEICTYFTVTYVAFFYIYHLNVIKALYVFKLLVGINFCHLKAHLCEI